MGRTLAAGFPQEQLAAVIRIKSTVLGLAELFDVMWKAPAGDYPIQIMVKIARVFR